ncbi:hypothetical protein ACHAWC_002704 [Mediolabrus comicus]
MIPRIRKGRGGGGCRRWRTQQASLDREAKRLPNKIVRRFQLASLAVIIVVYLLPSSFAFQQCRLASSRQQQHTLTRSAAAASVTTNAVETHHNPSDEKSSRIQKTITTAAATIQTPSPEHDIELLSIYKSNKHLENNIVRLGRTGRTEQALQLYQAIWTLDSLKDQYRKIVQRRKSSSTSTTNDTAIQLEWNNEKLSPTLTNFVTKSKLKPTTRLMNSAIDACARATRPQKHQSTAFTIFHHATNSSNDDGTKKWSGALSPNVFTFGALLACCARNGDTESSLKLLHELEDGSVYPDVMPNGVIYSTVISACERSDEPNVDLALELLNNAIVTLSSSAGAAESGGGKGKTSVAAAMGVVGYNAAISTMARAAEWKMAVQLLDEMIIHSQSTSRFSSSPHSIVNWETSIPEVEMKPLLHVLHDDKYDDLDIVVPKPDEVTFGTVLAACERSGEWEELETSIPEVEMKPLLHVLHDDKYDDLDIVVPKPDEVTFGTVLAACERSGEWEELLRIAKAAIEYGVKLDGMALTSALHACQQLGLAEEALSYLELMKQLGDDDTPITRGRQRLGAKQPLRGPDGVAYRLAISACARAGGHRWQDGIRLLNEMRGSKSKDCAPDVVAYTAAIAGCSEAGEYTHAMKLIQTMRQEGIQPNVVTFSAVINACASASANLARKREEEDRSIGMEEVRLPMTRALKLLEAMKSPTSTTKPNIVTYNAAIRACAEGLNLAGAFNLLRQLKDDELEPTIVTYGSLMTACERVGDVEAASRVFRMVKEDNEDNDDIQANEIIYGAAISCCRKANEPERALLLLRKMISDELRPNTATFNTVIAALAEGKPDSKIDNNILWEKALAVFKVMKSKHAPAGVAPNRQTYNILIRCLDANLQPGYAESLLIAMRKDGFVPDVDLYTLTVRSYERCGNPMKALRLMESMREVGYHFYEVKMLDDAFKSGVKILNQVGRGFTSDDKSVKGPFFSTENDALDYFGDDDDYDDDDEYDYSLLNSLKY